MVVLQCVLQRVLQCGTTVGMFLLLLCVFCSLAVCDAVCVINNDGAGGSNGAVALVEADVEP